MDEKEKLETTVLAESTMDYSAAEESTRSSRSERGSSSPFNFGTEETKSLRSVRLISIFGLFCAIPLAVSVFFFTKNQERDLYELQFNDASRKVLESIGVTLENSFGALDNLAVSVVSSAHSLNQTFPNFRIPEFSIRAAKTLALSRAKVLVTCPLVTSDNYESWTNWTAQEGTTWVDETLKVQASDPNYYGPIVENYTTIDNSIYSGVGLEPNEEGRIYLPSWQAYPIVPYWPPYNFDYISGLSYTTAHLEMVEKGTIIITNPYLNPDPNDPAEMKDAILNAEWLYERSNPDEEPLEPASDLYFPLRDNLLSVESSHSEHPPVATFAVTFYWRDMIRDILPESTTGVVLVVENPCSASFTYRLDGPNTVLMGRGDLHDRHYSDMEVQSRVTDLGAYRIRESTYTGPALDEEHCPITFKIYPSKTFEDNNQTSNPWIFSGATALICLLSAVVFLVYDRFQERRQLKMMETAEKSNAVVSSLFPARIREKIMENQAAERAANRAGGSASTSGVPLYVNSPIAELYTHTTVSFADIAGFTAWASTRDASDVFTLLESIYYEFDAIARKRGVFKVETVGDSYVAVCGLPEPRKNHAVIMAKFCASCRTKMDQITKNLASKLGPGTENLCMRYGLNSGPITAGVLRGDRSRFQLFGDTANTASRMESTSLPNRIQASQKTADLLIAAGKGDWVTKREEVVDAKGKGTMTTYWVEPDEESRFFGQHSDHGGSGSFVVSANRLQHLIDFNVEVLENLLKDLVAYNLSVGTKKRGSKIGASTVLDFKTTTPRDEVIEVIPIPKDERNTTKATTVDPGDVQLPNAVLHQIRNFVTLLAYRHTNENPFHNFDHATHVAMSVRKLLARILKPLHLNSVDGTSGSKVDKILRSTYVLTSDPMIQFAVYFSALIHDADHPGVSNGTLSKESSPMAIKYGHKSCAEQNSVEIAWDLLMSKDFDDLRACMFANDEQMTRFRQLVVNAVMATDIFDRDLKSFRETRWSKAFPNDDGSACGGNVDLEGELRATIVIEHIIQASDVVHTMQHWTVYQKWNRRLFSEMRVAYKAKRTDRDPAEGWYKGELWFFDNYIIPLAQKLKECGVFGVSCDEVLDYARDNRMEWEQKGLETVRQWVEEDEAAQDVPKECARSSSESLSGTASPVPSEDDDIDV